MTCTNDRNNILYIILLFSLLVLFASVSLGDVSALSFTGNNVGGFHNKPEDDCDKVYGGSKYRITEDQWRKLDSKFRDIEPPTHTGLYATGDHYELYRVLTRELGFDAPNNAMEIYKMANLILLCGHEE